MPENTSSPSQKGRIFISYRRIDSAGYAGRIYDRLVANFGVEAIFMDVDTIEGGTDFVKVLEDAVQSCDVLIALIGRQWLSATDKDGKRRLDNPEDFVRIEIAVALKRNIRVIPVLVDGVDMPQSIELPENLKALARRNALQVNHHSFNPDVYRLIEHSVSALDEAEELRVRKAQALQATREKAAREKAEKEAAEKVRLEAEELARQKAAKEKAERESAEKALVKAEEEERQRIAKEKAEREAAEKDSLEKELWLDRLYTEGLAAFYTEDWDKANQRFQTILKEQPNNKKVTEKLVEIERQKESVKKTRLKSEEEERQRIAKEKAEREANERARKLAEEKIRKEKEEREKQAVQKEQSSKNRILEAAIEKQVSVGVSTSLFVWIKRLESKSIISVVSSIDEDVILDEDNVKSKGLEIEFPIEKGRILPVGISLRLVAHEFAPSVQQKKIIVPPEGDSEVCTFIVTANRAGRLLLNLEVLKDQVSLVTRTLHTTAIESEKKEPSSMVLVSIPIIVFVQPKSDGISVGGDISGSVVVSGSGNVINVGKQTEDNYKEKRKQISLEAKPLPSYRKAYRRLSPQIMVAIIGAVATILAALIGSPAIISLINRTPEPTVTYTPTKRPTPTKTIVPTATKTKVPTSTPTSTLTPVPQSSILFQDNFADGNADGWDPSDGTTGIVKKDETGNYVYEITGPDNYPQTWPGNKDWSNYAFESRIRIKKGTVFVLVRANGSSFYNVSINTSDISLARWNVNISEYKVVKSVKYPIQLNKWYLVRIEIVGQQYKLYIDNKLVTSYTYDANSPVTKGGVGYYIGGGETLQIDDVQVWTLK